MNILKRIYYNIKYEKVEEPQELGIGALVTEDALRIFENQGRNLNQTQKT